MTEIPPPTPEDLRLSLPAVHGHALLMLRAEPRGGTPDAFLGACLAAIRRCAAAEGEAKRLKSRACAVCNDTGKLDDAQGWDVGQEPGDCPFCPDRVRELLDERKRLREAEQSLLLTRAALKDALPYVETPHVRATLLRALEATEVPGG